MYVNVYTLCVCVCVCVCLFSSVESTAVCSWDWFVFHVTDLSESKARVSVEQHHLVQKLIVLCFFFIAEYLTRSWVLYKHCLLELLQDLLQPHLSSL